MSKKGVIIGSFIKKREVLSFLEILKNTYNIPMDRIYVFSIDENDDEFLITFKSSSKDYKTNRLYGSTVMHVKNGCIFSINALNRLIVSLYGEDVNPNDVEIDWDTYKDKLIILTNGELNIKSLSKIEDKCRFLTQ